ncbi:MAG: Hsp20/alpha crystallin family protein [Deltaproteobacteria bacterium]|jgi:HSP20 family protein|nr:Hsp20/alpha crystallin family protein [Deltaproteobacteria bacterium]MBW2372565.1 Hsp20/alpha crystallin family protein [Deltaproteobacteria bacterium]
MRLLSYDPWNALQHLQTEIERAFEQPHGFGLSGRGAFPPVNVFRGKDGYVARFEVPGLAPEDLSIETHGRTLTVSGKRETPEPAEGSIHRRECWTGEFSRSLQLPEDAATGNASAECKHGVLTVSIPHREEARPRRISVQAS